MEVCLEKIKIAELNAKACQNAIAFWQARLGQKDPTGAIYEATGVKIEKAAEQIKYWQKRLIDCQKGVESWEAEKNLLTTL